MNKHIIAFASVTYANKAKELFKKQGINASVIRTPKTMAGGCGYSVIAYASPEKLKDILEKNSVPFKSISEAKK